MIGACEVFKVLEVRKHPTDVDDCSGHVYELLEDGSGVYRCRKAGDFQDKNKEQPNDTGKHS